MTRTAKLPDRMHNAIVEWQKRHFSDYDYMIDNWSRFYSQKPFELVAKVGKLGSESIEVGEMKGRPKFQHAKEMPEEVMAQTANIIRAQASTELGSIQQHRESLHKAQDPKEQFDILRVMAEELRHGYQMFYLLCNDDWGEQGNQLAHQLAEQLLEMGTGSHVLDAFNIYFDSFVDNVAFTAIIDRVGKYQLHMQRVFAYAPMAASMPPMLTEEAFHLMSGVNPLRRWVRAYIEGSGNVSLDNVQKHINKWMPRGLEMFGDERGGEKNVRLGLKDMANREAMARYYDECKVEVVDSLNRILVQARLPHLSKEDAVALADRVNTSGESEQGIKPEDLLYLPDAKFFRRRGEHGYEMIDERGEKHTDVGTYLRRLRAALPEAYVTGRDFASYEKNLVAKNEGRDVDEEGLPFYG